MTEQEVALIKNSWSLLQNTEPVVIGQIFYKKLFEEAPSVEPLFTSSREEQAKKLISTLAVVVAQLDKLDELTPAIEQLAIRHVSYGAKPAHYDVVGSCLLWTLEHLLKDSWTPELADAWTKCYTILAGKMIAAAGTVRAEVN
jgi:hemoglobin-like flavoprotein